MLSVSLALLAAPAMAWEHVGYAWLPSEIPREWWMDDDLEDSLPPGSELDVVQRGWAGWEVEAAQCAGLANTYMGTQDFKAPDLYDGRTVFYWDDPDDTSEAGVLGVTIFPTSTDQNITVNGESYRHFLGTDIIFNNDVDWALPEDIEAGKCNGESDVVGVATHEIGHSWGMGHSCEQGEECNDSLLLAATMYWSVSACDTSQSDINDDDIAGISAIYGPYGSFTSSGARYGGTPLEVCFEASSEDTLEAVRWTFGDGATSGENPICHEYTTSGQYTVRVELDVSSPACGDQIVTYTDTKLGYVVSCQSPAPETGAEGFFQIQHVDGLEYQTINYTDTSVYGCVDTVQWEVYRGSSEADVSEANLVDFTGDGVGDRIGAWAPLLRFPEEGSYVVLMNVGGPGGLTASLLAVEAENVTSGGCSAIPTGLGGVGALALGAVAALRRRRS